MSKLKDYHLYLYRGDTFTLNVEYISPTGAIDLTGVTARMEIRDKVGSTEVLYDASNKLSINTAEGIISLNIPAIDVAGFSFNRAVYDLELIFPDGVVTTILKGAVVVQEDVTK